MSGHQSELTGTAPCTHGSGVGGTWVLRSWSCAHRLENTASPERSERTVSEQFDTAVHRSTCPVSPPPHPPREADMDRIIEEFVHQQNLWRFQTLLAETKDEPRRHHLSKLLAEEEAKDHPIAWSR
jgi:hypothetical protein